MPLTPEERERRAYIEGNTELAAALAGEIDYIDSRAEELEQEVEHLKSENDRLQAETDDLEERLDKAETQIEELNELNLQLLVGEDA